MAVPCQRQVDAQLYGAIKAVGIMTQKDIDHAWRHQFFTSLEIAVNKVPLMISGGSRLLIVNADQVQHFSVRLNWCSLLAQDANTPRGKESRDGFLGFSIELMVAEAAENTVGRTKVRERSHNLSLCCGIVGDVIAG